jgi:Ca2+-binding RTX toxin-like protein
VNKLSSVCRILCPLLVAASCSDDEQPPDPADNDFEGIEEAAQALTNLSSQCVWTATAAPPIAAGTMTLTLKGGDVAVVSKLSTGAMAVNGFACGAATSALLKKLVVVEDAAFPTAKTVILDYLGGMFGAGTSATLVGTDIDLGVGGGAIKIRGTKGNDTFQFGVSGIAINTDTFRDINYASTGGTVPLTFVVTMSDGDDSFTGAGSANLTGPATGSTAFTEDVTVYGGVGNDTLRGGDGDDTLSGGPGNDTFTTGTAADGADKMVGGGALTTPVGYDTADYSTRIVALVGALTLLNDGVGHSGADTTGTLLAPAPGSEGDNIAADILVIKGGAGNDTITGNDTGGNILSGNGGNDTFVQSAVLSANDVFNGGDGLDTVTYALRVNAANPILVTLDTLANDGEAAEHDKIMIDVENVTGGSGDDTLIGSAVDNVLSGGPGADKLSGGAGNDTLVGGLGDDILKGEAGDDTFNEEAAVTGADSMIGGAGVDTVDYSARILALFITMDATTIATTPFLTNTLTSGGTVGVGAVGTEGDLISTDVENCIGGHAADTINGNAGDNQLEGGADTATQIGIVDIIDGKAGDDVIDGGPGTDTITCGAGDDFLLDLTATNTALDCEI